MIDGLDDMLRAVEAFRAPVPASAYGDVHFTVGPAGDFTYLTEAFDYIMATPLGMDHPIVVETLTWHVDLEEGDVYIAPNGYGATVTLENMTIDNVSINGHANNSRLVSYADHITTEIITCNNVAYAGNLTEIQSSLKADASAVTVNMVVACIVDSLTAVNKGSVMAPASADMFTLTVAKVSTSDRAVVYIYTPTVFDGTLLADLAGASIEALTASRIIFTDTVTIISGDNVHSRGKSSISLYEAFTINATAAANVLTFTTTGGIYEGGAVLLAGVVTNNSGKPLSNIVENQVREDGNMLNYTNGAPVTEEP